MRKYKTWDVTRVYFKNLGVLWYGLRLRIILIRDAIEIHVRRNRLARNSLTMFRMFFVKFSSSAHFFVIQSGYQFVHYILQRLVRSENKNHSVDRKFGDLWISRTVTRQFTWCSVWLCWEHVCKKDSELPCWDAWGYSFYKLNREKPTYYYPLYRI